MGVTGWDTLYEHGGNGLYVPVDLQIARCRMCVAAPKTFDWAANVRSGARLRIATKYLKWSRDWFARAGVHVDLIKLYGSMELAPIAGLADAAHRHQGAMKLKRTDLMPIITAMRETALKKAEERRQKAALKS